MLVGSERDKYVIVSTLLEESEGEITEEIQDLLNDLDGDIKTLILIYCKRYKEQELLRIDREKKIETLKNRISSNEKSCEFWKSKVDDLMKLGKYNSLELDEYNIKYTKSSVVEITDENLIPDKYWKTPEAITPPKTINKVLIKEDIKKNIEITGAKILDKKTIKIN